MSATALTTATLSDRLLAQTVAQDGHLIWQGRFAKTLAVACMDGEQYGVARTLYEALHGPMGGHSVRRVCSNKRCVDPAHHKPGVKTVPPTEQPGARTSFVFDGSELGVNAFTAAPVRQIDPNAARVASNSRLTVKQLLATPKGGIVIGKQADSDKRAGLRKANI